MWNGDKNMMKKLMKAVEYCTTQELKMANIEFPMFHTDHEGVAIIEEEICETETEMQNMINAFNVLKIERVYGDMIDDEKKEVAEVLKISAQHLACESLQVAAMAQKFIDSMEARRNEKTIECFSFEKPSWITPKHEEDRDRLAEIIKKFKED